MHYDEEYRGFVSYEIPDFSLTIQNILKRYGYKVAHQVIEIHVCRRLRRR